MSKVPQERMPVGQRRVTPLLQSVASRKPRSVLPTVTRRNSIVLIAGIKRNLYLKGQTSGLRDRFATENKLLSPVPGPCSSMDFDQLETFLEVARHASFSRAAEKRFRTQPAISSQIRGVEEEVGAKLFDRSGGKVSLTAAGKAFLKYVEETLDARKAMMVAIAEMERVPRGEIIVGANEGTCLHMLPYVFADFKKQYPEVSVNIKRSDYAKILESIIDNSVDFGVISLPVNDKRLDRKSTRLNSSHLGISYAVFCLKKKKITKNARGRVNLKAWRIEVKLTRLAVHIANRYLNHRQTIIEKLTSMRTNLIVEEKVRLQ